MTRITTTFQRLKAEKKKALIPFIMAGDPDLDMSLEILKTLSKSGADLIEIGMPFTDPGADGPVIQLAGQRALRSGTTLPKILELVKSFRHTDKDTPIILMGYINPLHAYGEAQFFKDAKQAGVDGLLIVDAPAEEGADLVQLAQTNDLDLIRLATPTTDLERLKRITNGASGFLYYVSIAGVTGTKSAKIDDVAQHIQTLKTGTDLPIAIGFGIKTPDDARAMSNISDAIVVGSALVQTIHDNEHDKLSQALTEQIQALSSALIS